MDEQKNRLFPLVWHWSKLFYKAWIEDYTFDFIPSVRRKLNSHMHRSQQEEGFKTEESTMANADKRWK